MSILHVANLGHPVLKGKAQSVSKAELKKPTFQAFLDDLIESMDYHDGVGLAAPQVFHAVRVVAVVVPPDLDPEGKGIGPEVFINPELTPIGTAEEEDWEGCLSLKDLRGLVPRFRELTLEALDRQGQPISRKLVGYAARVLQHEVDHLDGVMFVDRMTSMDSLSFARELAWLNAQIEAELARDEEEEE